MIQTIAFILLGIGIGGMILVSIRGKKKEASKTKEEFLARDKTLEIFSKLLFQFQKRQILPKFSFQFEKSLKKNLLKIKIFLLRCENKIDDWLKKVSHSKKFSEDYWEKIKKK